MNFLGSGIDATEVEREVVCDAPAMVEQVDPTTGEVYTAEDPETPCGFAGEVEVRVDDWKQGHWTCPDCGTPHDMDPEKVYPPQEF